MYDTRTMGERGTHTAGVVGRSMVGGVEAWACRPEHREIVLKWQKKGSGLTYIKAVDDLDGYLMRLKGKACRVFTMEDCFIFEASEA